jgi:GNAT superfamily N-acetyltransferase
MLKWTFREEPTPEDRENIRSIVQSTGFFHPPEVDVAVELVDERLSKGTPSGYFFVFAEHEGRTVGYTCYGPIACTLASYDLYWIAVDESYRGQGLGRALVEETERQIHAVGGLRVYIETSDRPQYTPTRGFYDRCGYRLETVIEDFYAPGDGKAIYVKAL